jgi:hypothetical protein
MHHQGHSIVQQVITNHQEPFVIKASRKVYPHTLPHLYASQIPRLLVIILTLAPERLAVSRSSRLVGKSLESLLAQRSRGSSRGTVGPIAGLDVDGGSLGARTSVVRRHVVQRVRGLRSGGRGGEFACIGGDTGGF